MSNHIYWGGVAGLALVILAALLILLFLLALKTLRSRSRNMIRSDFKRTFQQNWGFRLGALVLAVVFAGALLAASWLRASTKARTVITLNYAEASWGANANGTRYNSSEILCDEVLERTIEMGAFEDVTVDQLRRCLTVEPLVQGSSYSEADYHIATEFLVTYQADKNTAHLDSENVVRLIGNAYKDFYIDTYTDNFSVLDLSLEPEDMEDLDYLDIVTYLENQAYQVANYMYALGEENASFFSSGGESFYSLAEKVTNLLEVQIQDRLESYLLHNGISKDTTSYVGRLEYDNVLTDYDIQRANASFRVRNEAVQMYDEEMTRVVLVPTWDDEGEYYMGRTKVGVDDLSTEAEQYSQSAAEDLSRMESNNTVISALNASGSSGEDPVAEQLITEICETLNGYALAAKTAGQEYSETKLNQCISSTALGVSYPLLALVCVGGAVLFYLAASLLMAAVRIPKSVRRSPGLPPEDGWTGQGEKDESQGRVGTPG